MNAKCKPFQNVSYKIYLKKIKQKIIKNINKLLISSLKGIY